MKKTYLNKIVTLPSCNVSNRDKVMRLNGRGWSMWTVDVNPQESVAATNLEENVFYQ